VATRFRRNGNGEYDLHWGFVEKILAGTAIVLLSTSLVAQVRLHIRMALVEQEVSNLKQYMKSRTRPAAPTHLGRSRPAFTALDTNGEMM